MTASPDTRTQDEIVFEYSAQAREDGMLYAITCIGTRASDEAWLLTHFIVSSTQAAAEHFGLALPSICDELKGRIEMALAATPLGCQRGAPNRVTAS